MKEAWNTFSKGILKENPVLRLVLGTCPTLAVTTAAINGIGMGLAATVVLVGSNLAISLLRNIIPDRVRIPAFITIIAGFVTIVQMLVKAFLPAIDSALGIYLPLIVVNCIILARAEMFACKNPVLPSILDGLGMGIGFTATLLAMGSIRELLGNGTLFGMSVTEGFISPMLVMILPPGGFFVFGILVALSNRLARRQGKKPVGNISCETCPGRAACEQTVCEEGFTVNVELNEAQSEEAEPSVESLADRERPSGENAGNEDTGAVNGEEGSND